MPFSKVIPFLCAVLFVTVSMSAAAQSQSAFSEESSRVMMPRTKKKCWKIECSGVIGKCYSWGEGSGIVLVEPGVMSRTQIDCDEAVIRPGDQEHDNIFVHDPGNQQVGYGYLNATAYINTFTNDAVLTEWTDTIEYSSYSTWQLALGLQ